MPLTDSEWPGAVSARLTAGRGGKEIANTYAKLVSAFGIAEPDFLRGVIVVSA